MCGIIGYVGTDPALSLVADGLHRLEYRGYDSTGIALCESSLSIYKSTGVIGDLTLPEESEATCAVGHTRWSTHGKPTDANAHPHTDCHGKIAVVHNGIIDNYETLREELSEHTFTSETDTEVIPHLVEEAWDGTDLTAAVQSVMNRLEGSFAICVVAEGQEEIIAARQDSPLVVGHGESGVFVASDVPAFIDRTRRVSYLENGDVATLTPESVTVTNDGSPVDRAVETVTWDAKAAEKGGYDHYMLKEIHEQPQALRQTLSGRIDVSGGEANLDISLPEEYVQSLEEIQIVAAGTSYHAGMYARNLLEQYADIRVSVEIASEYDMNGGRDPWRTLVIAITQSGETADTLDAMRRASRAGARTLAVTNTVGSTASREADHVVYIRAGPEIGVAATKTFAAQVATFGLLTVYLGQRRQTLSPEVATDLLERLRDVPGVMQRVLDRGDAVLEIAETYAHSDGFFFIGRKYGYPVALEGALKLKEVSYEHAEGFAGGELKHGPLALVTEETPVIALLTRGGAPEDLLNNVKEVESRGAPVVGCSSLASANKYLDAELEIEALGVFEPLVANVYLQLFAYYIARLRGRNIDKPRNLAKSVTVK